MDLLGGLDIVVNNAGISDEHQWEKMIDINLVRLVYSVCIHSHTKHAKTVFKFWIPICLLNGEGCNRCMVC